MRSLRWLLPLVAFGGVVLGVSVGVNGAGSRPAAASGLAVAVSAGSGHTCTLTTGGGVLCWGSNHDGQIGDGRTCDNACTTPANVSGLGGGVASISAGDLHTCAVNTKGGLVCWGANEDGQIGDGTTSPTRDVPTGVTGLGGEVASVSAGDLHSCAVSTAGGVKCWGLNEDGQLGDGRVCGDVCTTPVDVSGLTSGIAMVSAGGGTRAL
jgi:alpha-tubulin suppressor-like RCC1 family protein